jgi:hypothetical protein
MSKTIQKKAYKTQGRRYKLLIDLIGIVAVSVFAYTTAMIVVYYQMGVMWG